MSRRKPTQFERIVGANETIKFYADGNFIGAFTFTKEDFNGRQSLICYNKGRKRHPCLKIILHDHFVYLDDYFYEAHNGPFECDMKPSKTNPEYTHANILNTLLEFLASVTGVGQIALQDASTKSFLTCPDLEPSVFKLAGEPTFYERHGFQHEENDKKFTKMRNHKLATFDYLKKAISAAKQLHFQASTVTQLASLVVDSCKKGVDPRSAEDMEALAVILKAFHRLTIEFNINQSPIYKKNTLNKFKFNVKQHSKFLEVDISSTPAGTQKRPAEEVTRARTRKRHVAAEEEEDDEDEDDEDEEEEDEEEEEEDDWPEGEVISKKKPRPKPAQYAEL